MPRTVRTLLACGTAAAAALLAVPAAAAAAPSSAQDYTPTAQDRLPDLQVEPLSDFHVQILDGRRVVRFTVDISNRGDGPLEVAGSRTSTSTPQMSAVQYVHRDGGDHVAVPTDGVFEYASDDGHYHWHLQDAAEYSLQVPGEDRVRVSHKEGFCLMDTTRIEEEADAVPEAVFRGCDEGQPEGRALRTGISAGWSDPYPFDIWGQWIDLTGLPLPGQYCVAATADPLGLLVEEDRGNNRASALLDLTSNEATLVGTGC